MLSSFLRLPGAALAFALTCFFSVACGDAAEGDAHAGSGGTGGSSNADAQAGSSGSGTGGSGGGSGGATGGASGGGASGSGGGTGGAAGAGGNVAADAGTGDTGGSAGSSAASDAGTSDASSGSEGGVAAEGGARDGGAEAGGDLLTTFVKRQGLQFVEGTKRHTFVGANFWAGMNLGAEAAAGGDLARLRRELDRLQKLGITNVRIIAASEGPDTAPYRVTPSLMPSPGVYNEQIWKGLDIFLDELSRRHIRAVMILNNYWEWTGGMAQYVSWAENSKIPDRIAPGGDYNTYIKYVDKFYACTVCQTNYRAHIKKAIERVNTVNGRTYRDDPVIFSWQLANEPRDYSANWINDTAQYIKSLDPNHMVSVGSEGTWAENTTLAATTFAATHQSQYIDYTTCHIWVEPWGKYDPNDSSAAQLKTVTDFATNYLRDHDTRSKQLNKPLVLEEFGLARDGWTAGGKYDPKATVTNRDKYYTSLYSVVEASLAASGNALAGDNFWAWGGEARPPSKLAGDPPHETPGWFSIYDVDTSTTALISAHAAVVQK